MSTAFLLMAQYEGWAIMPLKAVRADYFPHLATAKFLRKIASAQIKLPVVRIEPSQKSARGIHVQDLADYLDHRREAPKRELMQMS
jgi:hypothetical protein